MEVFQKGNSKKEFNWKGMVLFPEYFHQLQLQKFKLLKKERRTKNIFADGHIPKEHKRKFHGMDMRKRIWKAIITMFGGNANSKKMQRPHGAEVSTEDANHKFLRSLPPAWSNLAMTMRTNPEDDNLCNALTQKGRSITNMV
ncbi:hypothetical protein Tco_1260449 [Tanacetum coccineum]